jgi:hypothetical protein
MRPADDQPAIGSAVLLDGCAALYLGRTATGGYAFAVGASAARKPVFVTKTLANVVRSKAGRPFATHRRPRRGRAWSRSA